MCGEGKVNCGGYETTTRSHASEGRDGEGKMKQAALE
jgi:hypothetical protein